MEDLKKVRLMTNLAIYDKHNGEEDRRITSLYRRDYIYRKNLSIRVGVFLGALVLLGIFYGYKVLVLEENIFELFVRKEMIKIGVFVLILIIVYTIIGMFINGRRYDLAEQRCENYEKMLSKLYVTDINNPDEEGRS